ncbi:hypothetical protein MNBD_ALPHA09-1505 [hydrothermal vent metagenome]|uniref:Uncharacterized protein n=1 Tax=hydrothermal vent metagenome TaxID=652676 RepID=A0A3B0T9K2_9ZZZZ
MNPNPGPTTAATASQPAVPLSLSVTLQAVAAGLLGLFILWGTGFAQPDALHNAAHDTRHAFALPCH